LWNDIFFISMCINFLGLYMKYAAENTLKEASREHG